MVTNVRIRAEFCATQRRQSPVRRAAGALIPTSAQPGGSRSSADVGTRHRISNETSERPT